MSEENKALVRTFFETQDREERTPMEFLAPDFTAYLPGGPPMDARGYEEREAIFFDAFSDIEHRIEDLLAENDRVAFRMTLNMSHTGEFMGIPASNKVASFSGIGILRIADGKIADFWGAPDVMSFMEQISAPTATDQTAAGD